ncbi:hypothetical protein AB3N59_06750 [Leptospira sp. WS92.C1]
MAFLHLVILFYEKETQSLYFGLFCFLMGFCSLFPEDESENFSLPDWIQEKREQTLESICEGLLYAANAVDLPDFKKDDITLLGIERSNLDRIWFLDLQLFSE